MKHLIGNPSEIGAVIRAARKAQKLRQDDAAGSIGVSESFMVKVERGAETVQWGKLFQILDGLGVRITVDIAEASPESLSDEILRAQRRSDRWQQRVATRQAAAKTSVNG
ncbi:helix-turn-helix domain-containing protein [Ralstonia solanacearum species complex bacterium KE056]|uniref:helix-turn-helix domain-containing protein n=1 Tax=Ralstonia solanacearum species complex bacterium KE056 TaxID=3119585 RepID=UPI002FC2C14E